MRGTTLGGAYWFFECRDGAYTIAGGVRELACELGARELGACDRGAVEPDRWECEVDVWCECADGRGCDCEYRMRWAFEAWIVRWDAATERTPSDSRAVTTLGGGENTSEDWTTGTLASI